MASVGEPLASCWLHATPHSTVESFSQKYLLRGSVSSRHSGGQPDWAGHATALHRRPQVTDAPTATMPSPRNGGYSPVGRDGMDELEQLECGQGKENAQNAPGGSGFNTARFKAMVRASYAAKTGGKKLLSERAVNENSSAANVALPKGPLPDVKPVSYKKKIARMLSRDGCTEGDRKRKAELARTLAKEEGKRAESNGEPCGGGGGGGFADVVTSMFERKVRFDVESQQHTPCKTSSRPAAPPQTPGTPGVPQSACGWLSCPAPNFGWNAPETPKGSKPKGGGLRA